MIRGRRTRRVIPLIIAADTTIYNVFTAAGSPTDVVDVVLTINSGVTVGSTGAGLAAIRTAGFAIGSTIRIVNNGSIKGAGGNGGDGGPGGAFGVGTSAALNGVDGSVGGDAIDARLPIIIDNTSGNIFGGGGGAGGGGGNNGLFHSGCGGGGGGGGQGRGALNTSFSGIGGNGGAGGGGNGSGGGSGSDINGSGIGGAGGGSGAGNGGVGGGWGQAGPSGDTAPGDAGQGIGGAGGAGGAAGYAVRLNGNSITWLGGNSGAQVKGSVA